MQRTEELAYAAAKKTVLAIDPGSGRRVWRHELDEFFASYVTIALHGDILLAAHKGSLYALDARTGERLWKTSHWKSGSMPTMLLSGLNPSDGALLAMAQHQSAQATAAAASAG